VCSSVGLLSTQENKSQQAVGVLEPNLPHGLLDTQTHHTASGLGEQSLHVAGVLGPELNSVVLLPGEPSMLACAFCYP
jgi:hypothetical protein